MLMNSLFLRSCDENLSIDPAEDRPAGFFFSTTAGTCGRPSVTSFYQGVSNQSKALESS